MCMKEKEDKKRIAAPLEKMMELNKVVDEIAPEKWVEYTDHGEMEELIGKLQRLLATKLQIEKGVPTNTDTKERVAPWKNETEELTLEVVKKDEDLAEMWDALKPIARIKLLEEIQIHLNAKGPQSLEAKRTAIVNYLFSFMDSKASYEAWKDRDDLKENVEACKWCGCHKKYYVIATRCPDCNAIEVFDETNNAWYQAKIGLPTEPTEPHYCPDCGQHMRYDESVTCKCGAIWVWDETEGKWDYATTRLPAEQPKQEMTKEQEQDCRIYLMNRAITDIVNRIDKLEQNR